MRKILLVTGSRGEYGYIRPILRLMQLEEEVEYEILATNMHLLSEYGDTINKFVEDGFEVHYQPYMTLAGYSPESMVKSLSVLGLSLADILSKSRPDIILLAGDRGEQLMAAIAGAHMNIPVAHIQAGEVSGNIDGLSRHAIARFSHIHFASNDDAANRLLKSGEEEFRIYNVGAPQLDEFMSGQVSGVESIEKKYGISAGKYILMVQHSVTEQYNDAYAQVANTLTALQKINVPVIIILPNSDAGSSFVNNAIDDYPSENFYVFRNLPREDYAGLMKYALCMIGNSSSGLLEAPTFELPAVNIGRRQLGRHHGENVINCGHEINEILAALEMATSKSFKMSLSGMCNPYGDGNSSKRIVEVLKNISIDDALLMKKMTY